MHLNGRPADSPPDPPPPAPRMGRRIVLFVALFLLLPVLAIFVVFPALVDQPFHAVGELDPGNVRKVEAFLLNRAELDGGEDVRPFTADPADVPALLAPLLAAREVSAYQGPEARGPWFGYLRVRLTDGRRGTIQLYWARDPHRPPAAPAKLRFEIGGKRYEGGSVAEVVRVVEQAARHVGGG